MSPVTVSEFVVTVYTSEALDNDGSSTEMSRFERSVFTTAAFSVVLLTDHTPLHLLRLHTTTALQAER